MSQHLPPPSHLRVAPSPAEDIITSDGVADTQHPLADWSLLYDTLFHPVQTFKAINQASPLPLKIVLMAAFFNLALSALCAIARCVQTGDLSLGGLSVQLPLIMALGLSSWIVVGLLMATLSYVFTGVTRFQTFLVLSALSSLPWGLMPPLVLLQKGLGPLGGVLAGVAYFGLWLWTTTLYTMAVSITYKMSAIQVMLFFALPLLAFGLLLAMLIPVMLASILGWFVGL
jgi:hypothetical protein